MKCSQQTYLAKQSDAISVLVGYSYESHERKVNRRGTEIASECTLIQQTHEREWAESVWESRSTRAARTVALVQPFVCCIHHIVTENIYSVYLSLTSLSKNGFLGRRFMISDSASSYASDMAGT